MFLKTKYFKKIQQMFVVHFQVVNLTYQLSEYQL